MSKSSLPKRILGGTLLVVALIGGVMLGKFTCLAIFAFGLAGMMSEYYRMAFADGKYALERILLTALAVAVFAYVVLSQAYGLPLKYLLLALPLLMVVFMLLLVNQSGDIANLKVQDITFPLVYLLPAFAVSSRIMFDKEGLYSPWMFIAVICVLWMSDVGGYAFGMAFGQKQGSRKIAPTLSPKKSLAGVFGSVVFTLATSAFMYICFNLQLTVWQWAAISVIAVLFGIFGDLFESLLKRHYGLKDSGSIIIGHGGLMDRFDAVVFALPAITVFLLLTGAI